MSRKIKNIIIEKRKNTNKECKRSKVKKIGKRVVFSTLTATMLVNALPFHQSSTTVGAAFAAEGRTAENFGREEDDIDLARFNLNMEIDYSVKSLEDKLDKIFSSKNNPEIEEDIIYREIAKISDEIKGKLLKSDSLEEIKIELKEEYEKKINDLLEDLIYTYNFDSNLYIIENPEKEQFEIIEEKLPFAYNSFAHPMDSQETSHMDTTALMESNETAQDINNVRDNEHKEGNVSNKVEKINIEKLKEQKAIMEKMKAKEIEKALSNKQRIRIAGRNRRETALGISRIKFNSSSKIILVNQDSFADSLTASVLAERMNVPILLTDSKNLSPEVLLEMQRLKTSEVLILGGKSAVSNNVEEKLKSMKVKVERLAGEDRYETSALVAEKVYKMSGHNKGAIIASGEDYPDALAIAPVAARDSQPILLVKNNEMPEKIEDILVYNSVKDVTIVGGEKSVSTDIENKLKTRNLTRISGKDRYDTATKIASEKFRDPHTIYIATGENFADALTAGPVAATTNAPILLVSKKSFSSGLKNYIDKSKAFALIFLGGEDSIPKSFEDQLAMIGNEKTRAIAEMKLEKVRRNLLNQLEKITILKPEEKKLILKEISEATNEKDINDIVSKFKKFEIEMKKMQEEAKKEQERSKPQIENEASRQEYLTRIDQNHDENSVQSHELSERTEMTTEMTTHE